MEHHDFKPAKLPIAKMISQISLCLGLISIALAAPAVIPPTNNTDAAVPNITDWMENGLFEGDLKLSK